MSTELLATSHFRLNGESFITMVNDTQQGGAVSATTDFKVAQHESSTLFCLKEFLNKVRSQSGPHCNHNKQKRAEP